MLAHSMKTVTRPIQSGWRGRVGPLVLWTWLVVVLLSNAGCGASVMRVQRGTAPMNAGAKWVLLPFANHSEAPRGAERVGALTETVLRMRGVTDLTTYIDAPADGERDARIAALLDNQQQEAPRALAWAKSRGFTYAVCGSVEEWRYKGGVDGAPAVGVSIRVLDLAKDSVIWSASGTDTGPANEAASGTALRLVDELLAQLQFR